MMEDGMPDEMAGDAASARVDAIIAKATGTLSICDGPWRGPSLDSPSPARALLVTGPPTYSEPFFPNSPAASSLARRARKAMRPMGTGAVPNAARGHEVREEIANIVAAKRCPAEVRAYVENRDFGRVPPFFEELRLEMEEEQERIASMQEREVESESPRQPVRLLAQVEKDTLIRGLKQQLQHTTAMYLSAAPKSRCRAELEGELERITQDIDNLSRPYIFVEDDGED